MKTYTEKDSYKLQNLFLTKFNLRASPTDITKARVAVHQFYTGNQGSYQQVLDLTTYVYVKEDSVTRSGAYRGCSAPKLAKCKSVFVLVGEEIYIADESSFSLPDGYEYSLKLAAFDAVPVGHDEEAVKAEIKQEIAKIEKQLANLRAKL